jgi:hypothetical protein
MLALTQIGIVTTAYVVSVALTAISGIIFAFLYKLCLTS